MKVADAYKEGYIAGLEQGRREVIRVIEDYEGCYLDRRFFKSIYWKNRLKEWGME